MFLFEGYFGTILHTGDFRYTPRMFQSMPRLASGRLQVDDVYLDDTFGDPKYTHFVTTDEAVRQVKQLVDQYPEHRFVLSSDNLGKEQYLVALSRATQSLIAVSDDRLATLCCIAKHDREHKYVRFNADDPRCHFTTHADEALFTAMPKVKVNATTLQRLNRSYPTIGISTSGWASDRKEHAVSMLSQHLHAQHARQHDLSGQVVHIPYSAHSSFDGLEAFLKRINPRRIHLLEGHFPYFRLHGHKYTRRSDMPATSTAAAAASSTGTRSRQRRMPHWFLKMRTHQNKASGRVGNRARPDPYAAGNQATPMSVLRRISKGKRGAPILGEWSSQSQELSSPRREQGKTSKSGNDDDGTTAADHQVKLDSSDADTQAEVASAFTAASAVMQLARTRLPHLEYTKPRQNFIEQEFNIVSMVDADDADGADDEKDELCSSLPSSLDLPLADPVFVQECPTAIKQEHVDKHRQCSHSAKKEKKSKKHKKKQPKQSEPSHQVSTQHIQTVSRTSALIRKRKSTSKENRHITESCQHKRSQSGQAASPSMSLPHDHCHRSKSIKKQSRKSARKRKRRKKTECTNPGTPDLTPPSLSQSLFGGTCDIAAALLLMDQDQDQDT
jgi:DNA repair metallo-beta-lactamase